jgi:hypothetical protein
VKVISCIEDQDIIDRILAHIRDKEQDTPTFPLLLSRACYHAPVTTRLGLDSNDVRDHLFE